MKKLLNTVSVAVLALTLAACATSMPETVKPENMPKAYQAPADESVDKEVTAEWWKSFDNSELTGFVAEAEKGNLDLAVAQARVRQAQASTGISTADLFPTATVTGSATRTGGRGYGYNSFGLKGAASYELDLWGANVNSLRAARNTALAAIYNEDSTRITMQASVANAYFAVLALRERIAVAHANVEAAKRILSITQAKVSNGVLSNLELAQQTATVLAQEATIPSLEEAEREQRNALAILLGRMPGQLTVEGTAIGELAAPPVKPGLPATLLTRRPDVAMAEAQLRSAHANLDAARAAFLPGVSLTASGGWGSTVFNGLISPGNLAWSIGSSVAQTIFDGGRLTSTRDYYKAAEDELLATYRAAVLSALNDTETEIGSVASYSKREKLTAEEVKNAQEAFRISELQYREGVVDLLTVLSAQQTLFSAQDTLIQIKLARLQAGVGLYRALGGGWDVAQDEDKDLRNTFIPVPDLTDLPIGVPDLPISLPY